MGSSRENVLIVGLGLLGASLAMALKKAGGRRVMGWTRNASARESLLSKGALDETAESPDSLIGKADLTVLCMPVPQIGEFVVEKAALWRKGSVVSDVGSVKRLIDEQAAPALAAQGVEFIGGHPMAGSEKSGPDAAFPGLFEKAVVFLTPSASSSKEAVSKLRALWEAAGAKPCETDPCSHDAVMAGVSHLPHVIAWALALSVLGKEDGSEALTRLACASSFRDMTRVAASSPDLWTGIFAANKDRLLDSIVHFQERLRIMKEFIEQGRFEDLREDIAKGKALRDAWHSDKYGDRA